tara:strand:+ start:1261 stop:1461 length:201 start_codon:yes stop_codon:yes gene_type:complete
MDNDELTEYEPFSDEEMVQIDDLKIHYKEKNIVKQKIEIKTEQIKLPDINKKRIEKKKLLRILSKR